jgi:hypothetical protein
MSLNACFNMFFLANATQLRQIRQGLRVAPYLSMAVKMRLIKFGYRIRRGALSPVVGLYSS